MWNDKFELSDGSYSVPDIQGYFEHIIKNHDAVTNNIPLRIYINKIQNIIAFKIKKEHYLQLLTPEMTKLLGNTKSKISKDENGENVPHLEVTEIVLFHCNIVNNNCQQNSRVLYTFALNKLLGQLLNISPKKFIFLKTFHSEFSFHLWFTYQNFKSLEIEDKIRTNLAIYWGVIFVQTMDFWLLPEI